MSFMKLGLLHRSSPVLDSVASSLRRYFEAQASSFAEPQGYYSKILQDCEQRRHETARQPSRLTARGIRKKQRKISADKNNPWRFPS
jgi:hypothetical protein